MHVLGHYGKENAAAIFELFLECMPEYPLDKPDNEGNTGTMLAFVAEVIKLQCGNHWCFSKRMTATCMLLQFCCWPT